MSDCDCDCDCHLHGTEYFAFECLRCGHGPTDAARLFRPCPPICEHRPATHPLHGRAGHGATELFCHRCNTWDLTDGPCLGPQLNSADADKRQQFYRDGMMAKFRADVELLERCGEMS